jgi:hypothetical protein
MLIGKMQHTVGNSRRRVVDYTTFLEPGKNSISSATGSADATDVTITSVTVLEGRKVQFFVNGGSLNETFTVTLQLTLRTTETVTDTIQFTCVAP